MTAMEIAPGPRSIAAAGCRELDPLIAVLGTGALDAAEEARVVAHLAACDRCAELARLFDGDAPSSGDLPATSGETARPRRELVPGATIAGRYRLDRLLGAGGMGVVWAATQSPTGQRVAVKLLGPRGADPRARRRFLREARAVCAVRHPNIVRIYDVVEAEDGSPALVMELLAGHTLQRRFDRGPMALGELCHVAGRVASSLGAAHAAGVVHRDLKPDNVFLARAEGGAVEVKVLDFGVAKRTRLEHGIQSGTLTRTGALVGTPFYMSPEQALGDDDIDARADIWALGIMLYQGLSGVLPTRGDNLGRVIKAVAMTPIEPIERLVPGLPPDVAELVGRMLGKAREGRPGSMDEVHAVLSRHEGSSIDGAPELDAEIPPSHPSRAPTADEHEAPRATPDLDRASPRPRSPRALIAVGGAALLIGAAGFVAIRTMNHPSATSAVVASSSLPLVTAPVVTDAPPAPQSTASSAADNVSPAAPASAAGQVPTASARPPVEKRGGAPRGAAAGGPASSAAPAPLPATSASSPTSDIGVDRDY